MRRTIAWFARIAMSRDSPAATTVEELLVDTGWIVAGLLAFVIIAMIAWYVVAMFRFTFRG